MPESPQPDSDESSLGKYGWKNPHPFWQRIITFALMLAACTLAAFVNASSFDQTEVNLLIMLAGVLGIREAWGAWKDKPKKDGQ